MVIPGKRIPTRGKRTGSVSIVTPKKLMRTVECPSHASVTPLSFHFDGSGLANAGAIGRQLSTVHSRNRWPSQRRTLEPRGIGCCGACTRERNTAILLAEVDQLEAWKDDQQRCLSCIPMACRTIL